MLGNDFRKMYTQLKGVEESRAETCYSYTSKILSNLLGALFIRKRFSAEVKSDVSIWVSCTICITSFPRIIIIIACHHYWLSLVTIITPYLHRYPVSPSLPPCHHNYPVLPPLPCITIITLIIIITLLSFNKYGGVHDRGVNFRSLQGGRNDERYNRGVQR